jgi:uncharacterized membrane protein YfcA
MHLFGYFAAVIIGVSLGLIGGGGSILTVPVLVYLFGVNPVLASAYSLFIVGSTSLFGVIPKYKLGLVDFKTAAIFGVPAIVAVYLTRLMILPLIPEKIFSIGSFIITKPMLLMLIFAILMVFAAFSMIREKNMAVSENKTVALKYNYPMILLEGIIVGVLTGLVGAGGGFLIIPALVLFSRLPMKLAVGTSLVIITAKSLIGFLGDLSHFTIDWRFLLTITGLAIAGIFIGNKWSSRFSSLSLRRGFGWFVLVMGSYIIVKELFLT